MSSVPLAVGAGVEVGVAAERSLSVVATVDIGNAVVVVVRVHAGVAVRPSPSVSVGPSLATNNGRCRSAPRPVIQIDVAVELIEVSPASQNAVASSSVAGIRRSAGSLSGQRRWPEPVDAARAVVAGVEARCRRRRTRHESVRIRRRRQNAVVVVVRVHAGVATDRRRHVS